MDAEAVDVRDSEDGGQFGSLPGPPGLGGQEFQDLAAPVGTGQVRKRGRVAPAAMGRSACQFAGQAAGPVEQPPGGVAVDGPQRVDDVEKAAPDSGTSPIRVMTVPRWRPGLGVSVLPRAYQDVLEAPVYAGGAMRAKKIVAALGLPVQAAKVYDTPVPADCFASAKNTFNCLIGQLADPATAAFTHDLLEEMLAEQGRELLRRLLQAHLDLRAVRLACPGRAECVSGRCGVVAAGGASQSRAGPAGGGRGGRVHQAEHNLIA
ncbi:hypothetical protein FHR32_002194 [Streptosporangium album]|uniref:Uncharacterized protein n=1 Tax=Streptosporangium album TaxID=47479 RepID=A0A7W7W9B4_9ACTN|nr:hypothetical protein [Streptosporangium album]MBB4937889.1 hypothetical protein [Streptosporangium album]